MVERETKRDVASPIVPDDSETLVTELVHESDEVIRHGPFGRAMVVGRGGWTTRASVAAQVRAHHAQSVVDQLGGDAMPGRRRARMTVHQQHGRAYTAVANED